jgi:hypothetical protein
MEMEVMGYAEECERLASIGFSGSDAACIAGSGVHPRYYVDTDDAEDERDAQDDAIIELLTNRMMERDRGER